jgi:N4-gp56 family major capsid protein
MPIVNRNSLPQEYFDVTSPKLLVKPEPQYFHAQLFKMAMMVDFGLPQGGPMGLPVPGRPIPDAGADYTSAEYDRLMLINPDPVYSSAVNFIAEIGKRPGQTVKLNRPVYGSGGFTLAAREIPSGVTISTTAIDVASEQNELTLKRYGGPYDPVAGNVAPYAIDKFDALVSLHSFTQIVGKQLQRDIDRWLDQVLVAMGNNANTTIWPGAVTADSQMSTAGDTPFDIDTILRVEETLSNANIPRFPNGRYMGVISPTQARQIKEDPLFAAYSKYGQGPAIADRQADTSKNPLFASYVGTIGNVEVFWSTSLIPTVNGNGVSVQSAQFFGPSTWGAGIGALPEVAPNTQDNYGQSALVIWLLFAAFNLLDNTFILNAHSD